MGMRYVGGFVSPSAENRDGLNVYTQPSSRPVLNISLFLTISVLLHCPSFRINHLSRSRHLVPSSSFFLLLHHE